MRWYVVPSTALLLIPACRSDDGNKALGLEPPVRTPAPQQVSDPIEQRGPGQADQPGAATPPPPAGGADENGCVTPPSEEPSESDSESDSAAAAARACEPSAE